MSGIDVTEYYVKAVPPRHSSTTVYDYSDCDEDETIGTGTIIIGILFVIIICVFIHRSMCSKKSADYENFTNMLSDAGWIMVSSDSCIYCARQREILKSDSDLSGFNNFMTVEEFIKEFPNSTGFDGGVPFWYNRRLRRGIAGLQTVERLRGMARVG